MCQLCGALSGFGAARREQFNHVVAQVHLIVQIPALQQVELPVQFRGYAGVGQMLCQVGLMYERAVKVANHIKSDAGGVCRFAVYLNAQIVSPPHFALS